MYGSFFGFNTRPFAATPAVESYFPAQAIEHSRQTLVRIIERAEGPGLVVGAAGVGKSLLCRLLAQYFKESFDVVMLSSARICTRKALLQHILFELKLPYRGLEEGELRLALLDFLQPGQSDSKGLLLLVDEAHSLPVRLLDELRMITNLVRDGQPRACLVLAGDPKLDERFTHPKLESFNQRLAARCYLEALTYDETLEYVRSQIRAAGGVPDTVFTVDALQSVHRASDGIPRLINQICDHALLLASAGGRGQLDSDGINEAWSDLQQLPAPWYDHEAQPSTDPVVEFGDLGESAEHPTPPDVVEPPPDVVEPDESARGTWIDWLTSDETPVDVLDTGWQLLSQPMEQTEHEHLQIDFQEEASEIVSLETRPGSQIGASPEASSLEAQEHAPPTERVASEEIVESNPFGDAFEEEEIVIDRLASLELEAFRDCPQVLSDESLELASVLPHTEEVIETIAFPGEAEQVPESDIAADLCEQSEPHQGEHSDEDSFAVTVEQAWKAESVVAPVFEFTVLEAGPDQALATGFGDTVQPKSSDAEQPSAEADVDFACVEFTQTEDPVADDRDMFIIETPDRESDVLAEPRASASSRPIEYQELFAQLRKPSA